jgi:CubicO group peptidase (beta-lactamase class C family)
MVERVNSNMSLQDYMERDIWAPLAISTATFRLDNRPDLKERLPDMTCRQGLIHPLFGTTMSPMGNIVRDHNSTAITEPTVTELSSDDDELSLDNDDFGGCGVYCSAPDFAKLLSSLCNTSPSTSHYPVLRPSTVNLMFSPQLTSVPAKTQLRNLTRIPEVKNVFGALPLYQHPPLDLDWGFGGMLVLDDIWDVSKLEQSMTMATDRVLSGLGLGNPNEKTSSNEQQQARRTKSRGTMFSGGTTNLYWWVDRAAGVSGVWASQLVPVGDPWTVKMIREFEAVVYEQVRVRGGKYGA